MLSVQRGAYKDLVTVLSVGRLVRDRELQRKVRIIQPFIFEKYLMIVTLFFRGKTVFLPIKTWSSQK